jgi:endogenous inhibitor of DNA gyrase (YacG/DUF329 family)
MLITCSRCGSESVRTSRSRSISGKALNMIGLFAFRCQDCDHRFRASIWRARQALYAKCSRCHRMDLSKWNTEHYNPPFWTRVMVACGAKAVRCEYCRHNFWSFRRVKMSFNILKRFERSPIVIPAFDESPSIEAEDHPTIGHSPELATRRSR